MDITSQMIFIITGMIWSCSNFRGQRRLFLRMSLPTMELDGSYLTQYVYQLVLESHHPHKTVYLIFELVIVNDKLTVL